MFAVTSVTHDIGRTVYLVRVEETAYKAGTVAELDGTPQVLVTRDRYGRVIDGTVQAQQMKAAVEHYKTRLRSKS